MLLLPQDLSGFTKVMQWRCPGSANTGETHDTGQALIWGNVR